MATYLNVGIMQNSGSIYYETSLARIEQELENIMLSMNTPDLVVGSEFALGLQWEDWADSDNEPEKAYDCIPGRVTDRLGEMAKKHGIYFIPGSMSECETKEGKTVRYNSLPIFGPNGDLIDVYRKMCPYYPTEQGVTKGERYVVFEIPEKDIKVGVMICHDWCFPEISRNLTLMGAELLIRPAMDPEGLYETCKSIAPTRAFENQAYFLSVNMAGEFVGSYAYGHSMLAGPDGRVIYEAGSNAVSLSIALDIDMVKQARVYGTLNTEQLLRQLPYFNLSMPFADNLKSAPLYQSLPEPDLTLKDRKNHLMGQGFSSNTLDTIKT